MLLLTEGPHMYYVDPAHMELKGQIPWSVQLRPEAKNFKTFFVHTVKVMKNNWQLTDIKVFKITEEDYHTVNKLMIPHSVHGNVLNN